MVNPCALMLNSEQWTHSLVVTGERMMTVVGDVVTQLCRFPMWDYWLVWLSLGCTYAVISLGLCLSYADKSAKCQFQKIEYRVFKKNVRFKSWTFIFLLLVSGGDLGPQTGDVKCSFIFYSELCKLRQWLKSCWTHASTAQSYPKITFSQKHPPILHPLLDLGKHLHCFYARFWNLKARWGIKQKSTIKKSGVQDLRFF